MGNLATIRCSNRSGNCRVIRSISYTAFVYTLCKKMWDIIPIKTTGYTCIDVIEGLVFFYTLLFLKTVIITFLLHWKNIWILCYTLPTLRLKCHISVNIYLFNSNNRKARKTSEIFSKLTIKTPDRVQWRYY